MSNELRDELINQASDMMRTEDINTANGRSENESKRAHVVLVRVIGNVTSSIA